MTHSSQFLHQIKSITLDKIERQTSGDEPTFVRTLKARTANGCFEIHLFADAEEDLRIIEQIAR